MANGCALLLNIWNGIIPCCLWTYSKYVGKHWCIFELECVSVIIWCTLHYDTIAIAHTPATQIQAQGRRVLFLMVSCWLWMNSVCTLVLVHVRIWTSHYFVYDAAWHHHNYTLTCYSNNIWNAITNGYALLLIECMARTVYRVGSGRVVGTLVCIGARLN